MAHKEGTELIASVSDDGVLVITSLNTYRQEALAKNSEIELKRVIFLDPHDCLAVCDSTGNAYFYGVHDSIFKNKEILRKQYLTRSLISKNDDVFPI